jgi:peptidoglycan/xylan/chitin deacetylase (PgdA/CDA1 family)
VLLAPGELYALLCEKTPAQQRALMARITHSLDGPGEERDVHGILSLQELERLEDGGLITIGGHTHHGARLSLLPEAEQRREIQRNKQILEEAVGHGVAYFAYPYGDEHSYTAVTVRLLQGLGFALSCCVATGTVGVAEAARPYELPRIMVRDWTPFTVYRRLTAFLG